MDSLPENLSVEWNSRFSVEDNEGCSDEDDNGWAIQRLNAMSANRLRRPELVWRPDGCVGGPTALASDGDSLIACGTCSGSVTLLDASSGKVNYHVALTILSSIRTFTTLIFPLPCRSCILSTVTRVQSPALCLFTPTATTWRIGANCCTLYLQTPRLAFGSSFRLCLVLVVVVLLLGL